MSTSTWVQERQTAVDADGWRYDVESGEVLGRADVAGDWTIDSDERAEWALELLSKLEGEIVGIDARIAAVTKQLTAMRRERERRVEWWRYRFQAPLIEFARSRLSGRKRSVKFGWGTVAFRRTKGSHWITDMEAAIEFAKTWLPSAIKVKRSVNVGDILEARRVAEKEVEESVPCPFLASSDETECVSITTGINAEARE